MKRLRLVFFLLTAGLALSAQKYSVKKDVLYKDKVAVANLKGKVNLIKADLSIESMSGDELVKVARNFYPVEIPGEEDIIWYTFSFPQFGKEVLVGHTYSYMNKKQFLKYQFENVGIHFYEDGIREDDLSKLVDYSSKLQKDTLALIESIQFFKDNLAQGNSERDPDAEVLFRKFQNSEDLAVIKGFIPGETKDDEKPMIIGKITYVDNGVNGTAKIYKRLPNAINYEGEKTNYLLAGYIDLFETIPELYIYQDGKYLSHVEYRINKAANIAATAKEAAKYLVENGFL